MRERARDGRSGLASRKLGGVFNMHTAPLATRSTDRTACHSSKESEPRLALTALQTASLRYRHPLLRESRRDESHNANERQAEISVTPGSVSHCNGCHSMMGVTL